MRISRSLAGTAIATGVLGVSLGLGLTMASASASASPAVAHSVAARTTQAASTNQAASAARSSRAADATGLRTKPSTRSSAQAPKATRHQCRNMPGQSRSSGSAGSSATGS
jgi:hypothetical protein